MGVCDWTIMCDHIQGDCVTSLARTVFSLDLSVLVFILAVKIAFIMGLLLKDQLGFLFPYTVYVEPSSGGYGYHHDFDFGEAGVGGDYDYGATNYYPQYSDYNQYMIK